MALRHNLFPAPSFETGADVTLSPAGLGVARTNYCPVPDLRGIAGWTYTVSPEAAAPVQTVTPDGFLVERPVGHPAVFFDARLNIANGILTAGQQYVAGVRFWVPADGITSEWRLQHFSNGVTTSSAPVTLNPGQYTDALVQFQAGATGNFIRVMTDSAVVNTRLLVQLALIFDAGTGGTWFTGDTTDTDDFTYEWTGTPNASPSTESTTAVLASQSPNWAAAGEYSLRLQNVVSDPSAHALTEPFPVEPSTTYTASVRANLDEGQYWGGLDPDNDYQLRIGVTGDDSGVLGFGAQGVNVTSFAQRLSVTFTTGASDTEVRLILGCGSTLQQNSAIYYDAILVEEGSEAGDYFDGDTANSGAKSYSWEGEPHESVSVEFTDENAFESLTYGKAVGRFLAIVGDGPDTDPVENVNPDAVPLEGQVVFTPSPQGPHRVTETSDAAVHTNLVAVSDLSAMDQADADEMLLFADPGSSATVVPEGLEFFTPAFGGALVYGETEFPEPIDPADRASIGITITFDPGNNPARNWQFYATIYGLGGDAHIEDLGHPTGDGTVHFKLENEDISSIGPVYGVAWRFSSFSGPGGATYTIQSPTIMLESSLGGDPFNGNMGEGYEWTGDPNESPSTRTSPGELEAVATMWLAPIVGTLDDEGYLTIAGERGVGLVASDSPGLPELTYTASFALTHEGQPVPLPPVTFTVDTDGVVDLSTLE